MTFKNTMKSNFNQIIKNGISLLALTFVLGACKYQDVGDAVYPDQLVYLSASVGGVYDVSTVPAIISSARYTVDLGAKKLNIPLGIVRSGVTSDGEFSATLASNTDTINKLIAASKLVADILPSANYAIPASVTGVSGKNNASFILSLDLDYLRNNATKKFAVGVSMTDALPSRNVGLSTAIVTIDAKILKPVANFTSKVTAKSVAFTNTSTYGVTYSWNFGDNTAVDVAAAPTHIYTAAGTYTVTLTTTGITGSQDANVKTLTVVVL
jgi:PKD domain/Domain of unknown function (DUF1735)